MVSATAAGLRAGCHVHRRHRLPFPACQPIVAALRQQCFFPDAVFWGQRLLPHGGCDTEPLHASIPSLSAACEHAELKCAKCVLVSRDDYEACAMQCAAAFSSLLLQCTVWRLCDGCCCAGHGGRCLPWCLRPRQGSAHVAPSAPADTSPYPQQAQARDQRGRRYVLRYQQTRVFDAAAV